MDNKILTPVNGFGDYGALIASCGQDVIISGQYQRLVLAGAHIGDGRLLAYTGSKAGSMIASGMSAEAIDLRLLEIEHDFRGQGLYAPRLWLGRVGGLVSLDSSNIGDLYLGPADCCTVMDLNLADALVGTLHFGDCDEMRFGTLDLRGAVISGIEGVLPHAIGTLLIDYDSTRIPAEVRGKLYERTSH